MVPVAKGALLALSAGIRCEAVFLVQKDDPIHQQGGAIIESAPWGPVPEHGYVHTMYGIKGGSEELNTYHNDMVYKAAAWVADDWEECCGGITARQVYCKDIFTDNVLAESECSQQRKPATGKTCSAQGEVDCTPASGLNFTTIDMSGYTFKDLGHCYSWPYAAHEPPNKPGMDEWPLLCQGWAHYDTACHAGLAYGAFKKLDGSAMDPTYCGEKCIGLGMDAFGILHGTTCSCGPLAVNYKIWGDKTVRNELVMRPDHLKLYIHNGGTCPLKVYHYVGAYEYNGIPHVLQHEDLEVAAYVDRIQNNEVDLAANEEDGHEWEYGNAEIPAGLPWDRNCYPEQCAAGLLWNTPGSRVSSNGPWAEKTIVKYVFEDHVDQTRKDVFEDAIALFKDATCIEFQEITLGETITTPKFIAVTAPQTEGDSHKCYTKGLGMPPGDHALFVMGTCQNDEHLGEVLHILLEMLGFAPEQRRPDALLNYEGQGPYIWKVDYGMLKLETRFTGGMTSMFAPLAQTYMGSGGVRKPFDYKSIMMTTNVHNYLFHVPPGEISSLGQRHGFSPADLAMVNDAYSCSAPGKKKKTEFYTMNAATEQEVRLNAAKHHEENLKDLEQADKFQPEVAKQVRAILDRTSK